MDTYIKFNNRKDAKVMQQFLRDEGVKVSVLYPPTAPMIQGSNYYELRISN